MLGRDDRAGPSRAAHSKRNVSKNTIIDFNRKREVVWHVILLFGFIVFFAGLALPFITVRRVASNVSNFLLAEHMNTRASGLSHGFRSVLSEIETLSEYLAAVNDEIYFMRCDPTMIYHLVSFITKVADHAVATPTRVVLSLPDHYCHIEGNSSHYTLYFGYIENDDMILKVYNESVPLIDFDYENEGQFVQKLPVTDYKTNVFKASRNGTFWEPYFSITGKHPDTPQLDVMTALFIPNRGLDIVVSVGMEVESLLKVSPKEVETYVECRYVLVDLEDHVLLTSDTGVIHPMIDLETWKPNYPTLSELNDSLWSAAAEVLPTLGDNKVGHFHMGLNQYLCISYPVVPRDMTTSHRVYLVLAYDDAKEMVYGSTVSTVSVTFVIVMVIIFGGLWLLKINESKKQKKLRKERPDFSMSRPEGSDFSVLEKTVRRLRELELLFPEDMILNKVVDAIIVHLTERRNRQFDIDVPAPVPCLTTTDPFRAWKYVTLKHFKLDKIEFNYETFAEARGPMLVKLFVTLLWEHELIFQEIDPDALIKFLVDFTNPTYIRNPAHTAHVLYLIHELISGPFKYWLCDKVEIFALFFVAFVMEVRMDWSSLRCVDDGQQEDSADPLEYEAVVSIQKQYKVLTDEYFVVERNVDWVMSLFRFDVLLDPQDDTLLSGPVCGHFRALVRELSFSLSDRMEFDLLGEARVRIQSPNFSVQDDIADRRMFMKWLLKLCGYCAYMSKKEDMKKELSELNLNMSESELNDDVFVCTFHAEMASKVVWPWLSIFTNFNPLEDLVANLENTIKYWNSQVRKSRSNGELSLSGTETMSNSLGTDE